MGCDSISIANTSTASRTRKNISKHLKKIKKIMRIKTKKEEPEIRRLQKMKSFAKRNSFERRIEDLTTKISDDRVSTSSISSVRESSNLSKIGKNNKNTMLPKLLHTAQFDSMQSTKSSHNGSKVPPTEIRIPHFAYMIMALMFIYVMHGS